MVQPLAQAMQDLLGDRLHCDTGISLIRIDDDGFSIYDARDRLLARSRSLLLCCGAREVPLPELESRRDRWEGSGQFLLREDCQFHWHDRGYRDFDDFLDGFTAKQRKNVRRERRRVRPVSPCARGRAAARR